MARKTKANIGLLSKESEHNQTIKETSGLQSSGLQSSIQQSQVSLGRNIRFSKYNKHGFLEDAMGPAQRMHRGVRPNLTSQLPPWLAAGLAATLGLASPASAETWFTKGTCAFNGVPMGCRVNASADLSGHAWSATYVIHWADGMKQRITVGSDVRASVWVDGKETRAEQQRPDNKGRCVIRTVTGNVTSFDSGRQKVTGGEYSC